MDIHVKGKDYKIISKQLYIPVTTGAILLKKYDVHGTVDKFLGHGRKWKCYPWLISLTVEKKTKETIHNHSGRVPTLRYVNLPSVTFCVIMGFMEENQGGSLLAEKH